MIAGLEESKSCCTDGSHSRSKRKSPFPFFQSSHRFIESIYGGIAVSGVKIARFFPTAHPQSLVKILVLKIDRLINRHSVGSDRSGFFFAPVNNLACVPQTSQFSVFQMSSSKTATMTSQSNPLRKRKSESFFFSFGSSFLYCVIRF